MAELTSRVNGPDESIYCVMYEIMDANDPSRALCLTVHEVGSTAVCNFWSREKNTWSRVYPEQVVENSTAQPDMLIAIMMTATEKPEILRDVVGIGRLQLSLNSLTNLIADVVLA